MLNDMQDFTIWWFQNLPSFLSAEPIIYIIGLIIFAGIVKAFCYLGGLKR